MAILPLLPVIADIVVPPPPPPPHAVLSASPLPYGILAVVALGVLWFWRRRRAAHPPGRG